MGKWIKKVLLSDKVTISDDHIPVEKMAALIDGRLDIQKREQYIKHLNNCTRCYDLCEETMTDLSNPLLKEKKDSKWSGRSLYAMAASIIVAVMIGSGVYINHIKTLNIVTASINLDRQFKNIILENKSLSWQEPDRIRRFALLLQDRGIKAEHLKGVKLKTRYYQSKALFAPKEIMKVKIKNQVAYIEIIKTDNQ